MRKDYQLTSSHVSEDAVRNNEELVARILNLVREKFASKPIQSTEVGEKPVEVSPVVERRKPAIRRRRSELHYATPGRLRNLSSADLKHEANLLPDPKD